MLCLSFVPKHTLPRWFYSFVSGFWKNWYGYNIFFKNLLLQFFSKLYQGDQILRLYIYKLCFQFCIPPPSQRTIFFLSTVAWLRMMVAWINQFLVVWFDDISHSVCNSSLPSHYSFWKFYGTCLKVEKADLSVEGISLQHL